MWWSLAVVVVPLLLLLWLGLVMLRKYSAIYSHQHLLEFARNMTRIKQEALAAADAAPGLEQLTLTRLPPGALLTSAGIALFYTVGREQDGYVHQLSMSHRGDWFEPAAAKVLVAYVHTLLDLGATPIALALSDSGRYYMAFELDGDAHRDFADRPVKVPTLAEMPAIYQQCCERAENLEFRDFIAPKPPRG